ncbi:hypothetical protein MPSEU_000573100 [Mayamaea pseudoterrestris]|nr:hypothetical protein MPSEU_000573100 [Mayamaea pseudoterrestris]
MSSEMAAILDVSSLFRTETDLNAETYESPIVAILQEIRRKNVAAAAATNVNYTLDDAGSDPWESYDDHNSVSRQPQQPSWNSNIEAATTWICTCPQQASSPHGTTKVEQDSATMSQQPAISDQCFTCGRRKRSLTLPWAAARRGRSISSHGIQSMTTEIKNSGDPQHALALLRATPQLRVLSQASTDMTLCGRAGDRNVLVQFFISGETKDSSTPSTTATIMEDYKQSIMRERTNQQAASELASLLWVLSHEMSLEDFGIVESEVFSSVFGLVHSADKIKRMAGLACVDALLSVPSADEEKKAIKFANTLSNGLRAAHGDYEFLSAVARALGHMAQRAANVDFVESEVTRALEWLRTDRSERRLAACLSLKEFAINAPTTFHSKTSQAALGQSGSNLFLDIIFHAVHDAQPIVRACAADALSQCLKILMERQHASLTGLLCQVYFSMMDGLMAALPEKKRMSWQQTNTVDAQHHGSLLMVSTMLAYAGNFVGPRYEEICREVTKFTHSKQPLIRLEVVRLVPRLALSSPRDFGRRYLHQFLMFLLECASSASPPRVCLDIRPLAVTAIGQLIVALVDDETGEVIGASALPTLRIHDDPNGSSTGQIVEMAECGYVRQKLSDIFLLVRKGLGSSASPRMLNASLHCAANLVGALNDLALPYTSDLIDDMFRSGLSNDVIRCLYAMARCLPAEQGRIEERMLQEVSYCLAGNRNVYHPFMSARRASLNDQGIQNPQRRIDLLADVGTEAPDIQIDMAADNSTVASLVLSLQTLASFCGTTVRVSDSGAVVPLLPYVQEVAAPYLVHPSDDVRRAAALTCCVLLIPPDQVGQIGSYSGIIIENVLGRLLPVAVSDPSPSVRLCVVKAMDARYDSYLCQSHHLQELFLLLQDETVATRAAGLRLFGRLAAVNPGPILPVMRKFLNDLIIELHCGVHGRSREDATRLLVVFLRANSFQRLVQPVLASLVTALPLDKFAPPRLASASLEALGDLARATGMSLMPWVHDVIPHVLEIMLDQSSASKQRTSLRTLGQIAGSTAYVIRPYLDYPSLLSQVTSILPATKRAPWSLRREAMRTLGVLGALDPDRYNGVDTMTRKAGAVGGAYFEEVDHPGADSNGSAARLPASETRHVDVDDDQPAYLFMYEQYAMVAQPVSTLPPARRLSPASDEFYPTVAIQALMRVFRDPALAVHHGMVIQAIMFIFNSLGMGCVPFLRKVVPYMIGRIRMAGPSGVRESLLKELATLSLIVREHLRPYIADIFNVVEQYWSSKHLATVLNLVSKTAVGVPDEFRRFVPRLIRLLLTSLDELQIADWSASIFFFAEKERLEAEKLALILKSVSNLKCVLGDYLHVLVPAFLKLADALASILRQQVEVNEPVTLELLVLVYRTISSLVDSQRPSASQMSRLYFSGDQYSFPRSSENGLPSRVVQPLLRVLKVNPPRSPSGALAIVETLCVSASLIGGVKWVQLYDGFVREAIADWQKKFPALSIGSDALQPHSFKVDDRSYTLLDLYDDTIEALLKPPSQVSGALAIHRATSVSADGPHHPRIEVLAASHEGYAEARFPALQGPSSQNPQRRVNLTSLQRAWDVSQRSSRDDWDEWMRRFAIQLLREAPSPALRATANLAHAYQPLARELFSAAFACCWKELSQPYRVNLVAALETAFVSNVSPEILQQLLNLCEFMEHDQSGGLPIGIPILADLALHCRAYAKALHYREREYNLQRSNSCVESLISINRKLDLQDAALGVLKASSIETLVKETRPMRVDLSPNMSADHKYDLFYSVTWSTADSDISGSIDLTARQELWLMKLGSWSEALAVYQNKLDHDPADFESLLGCMRCLDASGEWRSVLGLFQKNLAPVTFTGVADNVNLQLRNDIPARLKRKAIRMCAHAAWRLGQWDDLEQFSSEMVRERSFPSSSAATVATGHDAIASAVDYDGAFYSAVLHVHRNEWLEAADAIDAARKAMDSRLTALMAESYNRAYPSMVTAQTLAEMEEIIELRKVEDRAKHSANQHPANRPSKENARERLLAVWRERLVGCRVDAEVHASVLAVRSLVLGPADEVEATIQLSTLSRQAQRYKFAERVLLRPLAELGADLNGPMFGFGLAETLGVRMGFNKFDTNSIATQIDKVVDSSGKPVLPIYGPNHQQWSRNLVNEAGGYDRLNVQHRLYLAYLNHLWYTGARGEAMSRLENLCDAVDLVTLCEDARDKSLCVTCWLELGEWKLSRSCTPNMPIADSTQFNVLAAFKRATTMENCGYLAWHAWALFNFRIAMQLDEQDNAVADGGYRVRVDRKQRNHIIAAVKGFVNAISMGRKRESASVQQDLLNLLTCLFKYGALTDVSNALKECVGAVDLEAWLGVLPQLLARIHMKDSNIRTILHPLLVRLGQKHPQALMYPLSVLVKSPVEERKVAAESLMNTLKEHASALVEEALMVSSELIRIAILWLETWHEGLEDASRLYFVEGNVSGMLEILLPLHEKVEAGGETMLEVDFLDNYGHDLASAHMHIKDYIRLVVDEGGSSVPSARHHRQSEEAEAAMNRAWDIYYTFFRRVNKQLPSLTSLEISQCSPALYQARSLELGVPGTYRVDGSYVKIDKFIPHVSVITSKQRPRKITVRGSDGKDYMFLLKGHEDLRQDERVMQLFGLVNALLVRDPQTRKQDLKIQRYAICPLSHNCGIVGWVPHSETLHSLIRDYRQSKKIPLNMENREMLKIAPDYDLLTVMQKVEVFTAASRKTTGRGNDLYEILWLKSTNSEEWLERRTRYTRSLAVMSIVGYILGLGDRHPSNLMIDKVSGRVLHIDFGDCFDVAMMRDKFPEKVPFRLTRMLIKAMEVSGIEGSYRSTCERTMMVLRESRDSLVAMLEAFVYDPLISWRLAALSPGDATSGRLHEGLDDVSSLTHPDVLTVVAGHGAPIDLVDRANRAAERGNVLHEPISEHPDEDNENEADDQEGVEDEDNDNLIIGNPTVRGSLTRGLSMRASSASVRSNRAARSLQMYSDIQELAANVVSESRIASITGERNRFDCMDTMQTNSSIARERSSLRQRELLSLVEREQGMIDGVHEETLNAKALKVIRRVQDKLSGNDFVDNDSVDDQVQRLIVQATSTENLCQLFVGWCAFW